MVAEILIIPENGQLESAKAGAQYIARGLAAIGVRVRENVSLCTDAKKLAQAVSAALERSNIVLTLGGMDRDGGFLAKSIISQGLGLPLEPDRECLGAVRAYCERAGEPFREGDEAYAELPRGAQAFLPSYGKAPGCVVSSASQHIILLPEPQQELAAMFNRYVRPYLSGNEASSTVTHVLRTYGVGERYVREQLAELTATANPAVTVQRDANEVLIRVSAHDERGQSAASVCAPVLREIARRMGDAAYGLDVDSIQTAVVGKMRKKELGLAIAEAGTGGMLTRVIGETVGGQDILRYSTTADEDDAKIKKLDCSPRLLKKRGGVSEYAAVSMAAGARKRADTEIGVAIAANVDDFEDRKSQPGLVYIAVCDAERVYVKKLVVGEGSVEDDIIVDAAISRSLNMIRLFVDYLPDAYKGAVSLEEALRGVSVTGRDSYEEDSPGGERPRSFWSALAGNFIIRKADEPKEKVKKFIFILAVLVFLGCAGYLGLRYYQSYTALNQAKALQSLYIEADTNGESVDSLFPGQYLEEFGPLWSANKDVVAFIDLEGTNVKYPVVQATDNDYYHRRDFYGNPSQHGVPYMDYRVDIGRPSDNMVVYGHNMTDGQIFGELLNYKKLEFYREHPVIGFDTLYRRGAYKIFAVFVTDADESRGSVFAYHDFINAKTDKDFEKYVEELKLRSVIDTDVDVKAGDELLTLSTCTYEFSDARFVIAARRLRDGEGEFDDIGRARLNPQPLYPDVWYETFKQQKPDFPESASVVTTPAANTSPSSTHVSELVASGGVSVVPISSSGPPPEEEASKAEPEAEASRIAASETALREASEKAASEAEASRIAASEAAMKLASEKAASEAEASRIAASEAAEKEAAEKAASEAAAARAVSEAAASQAAVQAAQKQSAEKASAEANAAAYAANAKSAARDAEQAAKLAEEASFYEQAESETEYAWEAAQQAKSHCEKAEAEAGKAGTEAAKASAGQAKQYADAAMIAFERAEKAAQELKDEDIPDTDTAGGGSGTKSSPDGTAGSGNAAGTLTVGANGKQVTMDALEVVSRIVQNEMGANFHPEAIKAQAVAAYTYILHGSQGGKVPSVVMASSATGKVKNAVAEVIGEAIYYKNSVAFTPYHATSAGRTTSSKDVWGGSYPYLVSVDSSIEEGLSSFKASTTMTRDKVESLLSSKLGIEAGGDPEDWFEVLSEAEGGYNGNMSVCGQTKTKSGTRITGRLLREQVLGLRSACFTVDYNGSADKFTFTTYGYGHGVGMSQNGANLYASGKGWSYVEILEHYYPGTSVK